MKENGLDYFFWNEIAFQEAVRRRVCAVCPDRGQDGYCRNPDPRGCALFRYLPDLVVHAQHLEKRDAEDYCRQVHIRVKMDCENPDRGGPCPYRDTFACGLDDLLPGLWAAILEEDKFLERRACPGMESAAA